MPLQVQCSFDVAIRRTQFDAADLLQVGRLCLNEQLIDGRYFDVANQTQIDTHPHARQQMHRFFAADGLSAAENAVGAADSIVQVLLAFADQVLASSPLVVDQDRDDVTDLSQQFLFTSARA